LTSQGRSYGIFQKAIQRRNVIAAVAAAKELPQLSLLDALELTMLIARKDSSRYPRVAARWLQRLLEEHPDATIEEAALAASCLVALPGVGHREAAQTLQAIGRKSD
jgi:endonuclease III